LRPPAVRRRDTAGPGLPTSGRPAPAAPFDHGHLSSGADTFPQVKVIETAGTELQRCAFDEPSVWVEEGPAVRLA
jgi:hypothetical protein